jgi:hypothetical protein
MVTQGLARVVQTRFDPAEHQLEAARAALVQAFGADPADLEIVADFPSTATSA